MALITGASRNLGAAFAHSFAAHGSRVVLNYSSPASEEDAIGVLESLPGEGHVLARADVSDPLGVDSMVAETRHSAGSIDVLVNNVGPFSMTPYCELVPQEFDRIWAANVRSAYLLSRALAPDMIQNRWGRIINISAGSAFVRNHSVYSLAKQGIITLTEQLALELGPRITVNCLAPGQIVESSPEIEALDPDFVPRMLARTPAGRFVTRAEVAEVAAILCTPVFDMVTGATIPVDGGGHLPV